MLSMVCDDYSEHQDSHNSNVSTRESAVIFHIHMRKRHEPNEGYECITRGRQYRQYGPLKYDGLENGAGIPKFLLFHKFYDRLGLRTKATTRSATTVKLTKENKHTDTMMLVRNALALLLVPLVAMASRGLHGDDEGDYDNDYSSEWWNPKKKTPSVYLGKLTDFLFVFLDGEKATKLEGDEGDAYGGDIAVNGDLSHAHMKCNDDVAYGGKIYTSSSEDNGIGEWSKILDNNPEQAQVRYDQAPLIKVLQTDFHTAMDEICDLEATEGYEAYDAEKHAENEIPLDFEDGKNRLIVIDVKEDKMKVEKPLILKGDPGDLFVFRWGYQKKPDGTCTYLEKVEFKNGGGIIPVGEVKPDRLIHAAGNIVGGGSGETPESLPSFPTYGLNHTRVGGSANDWDAGGFFVGYWLTVGKSNRENDGLGDAVFIGGWYTSAIKVSLKKGGTHVPQRFKDDIVSQFDVLVQCNHILDNPCFADKHDLRAIGLTDVTEALVIAILEGNGPGEVSGHNDNRNLRALGWASRASRMRCDNPYLCGVDSILYNRRRRQLSGVEDPVSGTGDSVAYDFPRVTEHHTLRTLLAYYGYPVTPKQDACIGESYCQLTYTMYPRESA